jgi:glutaredoxin
MRRIGWWLVVAAMAVGGTAPAGARSLATFGMCLDREGVVFYGTSWCPHCRAQQQELGRAMRYVHYVECSVDGGRETTDECKDADVTTFPTWVFPDGSRQTGRLSIATLAERSGCALDDDGDATE